MRSSRLGFLAAGVLLANGSPGLPTLGKLRPADGSHVFSLALRRSAAAPFEQIGTMTVSQQTAGRASRSIVRRVIVFDYGANARVLDTTRSVARTLAPVSERTHKPKEAIRFDVAGNVVTGQLTWPDSSRLIHDTLPGPAFNSTDLELVIRSLPLTEHYRASLPIYDPERGGYRLASVQVTGRTPARDAWIVAVEDHDAELTYHVSVATRELMEATIRNTTTGTEFRIIKVS